MSPSRAIRYGRDTATGPDLERHTMPTLVRLLTVLALVAGLVVAAMAALIHFVEPRQGTIVQSVPLEGLGRQPIRQRPIGPVPD